MNDKKIRALPFVIGVLSVMAFAYGLKSKLAPKNVSELAQSDSPKSPSSAKQNARALAASTSKNRVPAQSTQSGGILPAPTATIQTKDTVQKSNASQPMIQRQLTPPEIQSITTFMREIRRSVGSKSGPDDMYRELEGLNLHPRKSTSSNASTGDLVTIRAQASLSGVRYFHAQFMSDGNGLGPVAQHISFEVRPSADGMAIAKKLAGEIFALNITPTTETENYVEWNRNGRTLWIRKFTDLKTLKSDLFNARDNGDLGLVMVALELDPHAHEKD